MGHKSLLLALCLVLSLATAYGSSHCYQCASGGGNEEADSCESKIEKGEAPSCTTFQSNCMKISGQVDGKDVSLRTCGDVNWETIIGSKDKCIKSTDVPNFEFKLNRQVVELDDGIVCICSSDKCNPAGRNAPVVGGITILLSALFFSKMFL